jgi:hypothetical protein
VAVAKDQHRGTGSNSLQLMKASRHRRGEQFVATTAHTEEGTPADTSKSSVGSLLNGDTRP